MITCMIYSSMNSSILREARMVNMILCIDIILHEHSTVVPLDRLSLCRLSHFLLSPPASLYCCSEECACVFYFLKVLQMIYNYYERLFRPKFYVCELFKDHTIVHLRKNRDWKWFRIKKDWTTVYYDRSEFFIIG